MTETMIRILFITLLVSLGISSCDSSKEVDPLFYKMSEADSTRCMDEILSQVLTDTSQIQLIESRNSNREIIYCGISYIFRIRINSQDEVMIDMKVDSSNIAEKTYKFFMHNRNLTAQESESCMTEKSCPGFNFPYYYGYSLRQILKHKTEAQHELDEMKRSIGVDIESIRYHESEVEEWKVWEKAIELIDAPTIPQISSTTYVRFDYQRTTPKSKEVINQIAMAFYQMRNFECLKYFKETYLSLYERAQRTKQKVDLEKLEVLKLLHPSAFSDGCSDHTIGN